MVKGELDVGDVVFFKLLIEDLEILELMLESMFLSSV